jgi:glucose dehydrogenase/mono/diheme cytochrome c family protein
MFATLAIAACGGSGGTTMGTSTEAKAGQTEITPSVLDESASPSDAEREEGAGADWPTVGGDLGNTRYSSLNSINSENVAELHPVWQGSLSPELEGGPLEEESSPLVVDGVMYIVTPESNVVAVEGATGKKVWEWKSETKESELRAGGEVGVQGLALGEGMVYVETDAGKIVAIDVKTGKEVWGRLVVLGETFETSPPTPVFYDGVVYAGFSGSESGRGHVDAYDAKTGKLLWRTFVTCGPTETPPASGQCPKGKGDPNTGGGSVWTYPALDTKDGLLYVTTANPSTASGIKGDFKWTTSILALDIKTGNIKWGFQGVHHDLWDYDCTTPPVLFENEFGGAERRAVNFVCKTDLHYELEQQSGKPLIPIKEEPVPTSAEGITPDVAAQKKVAAAETQPVPENSKKSEVVPHCANEKLLPQPAPDGSKFLYSCDFAAPGSKRFIAWAIGGSGGQDGKTPLAYDPQTNSMLYCEIVNVEAEKIGEEVRGGAEIGVNKGWQGSVAAVDVRNNTTQWLHKYNAPEGGCRGGVTATAGDLVFSSANHGKISAFNAETGKELWSFQGPSNLWAAPVVYEADGHEYLAVYYGGQASITGGMTNKHYARMLVFSVDGETQPSVAKMPKSEFSKTEVEAIKLAAQGKVSLEEEQELLVEELTKLEAGAAPEEGEAEKETPAMEATKLLFSTNCGTCHTLAAAGTTGTVGPNLDQLKPSESIVEHQVINGGGGMPAFGREKILKPKEINEVAEYVSSVAGK